MGAVLAALRRLLIRLAAALWMVCQLVERCGQAVWDRVQLQAARAFVRMSPWRSSPWVSRVLRTVALRFEDSNLLYAVLMTDSLAVAPCSAGTRHPVLLAAIADTLGPLERAETVRLLAEHPDANNSTTPDILHSVMMDAAKQLNYHLLQSLLLFSAAEAAVGITGSNGQGILSRIATAETPPHSLMALLVPDVWEELAGDPELWVVKTAAADMLLRSVWAVTNSAAGTAAATSDLITAAQHVAQVMTDPTLLNVNNDRLFATGAMFVEFAILLAPRGQHIVLKSMLQGRWMLAEVQWIMTYTAIRHFIGEAANSTVAQQLNDIRKEKAAWQQRLVGMAAECKQLQRAAGVGCLGNVDPISPATSTACAATTAADTVPLAAASKALSFAVMQGQPYPVRSLLATRHSWPSLHLTLQGPSMLKQAIHSGSVDVFNLVLEAVVAATNAVSAVGGDEAAPAPCSDHDKVMLALSGLKEGGPEFFTALCSSTMCPKPSAWAQEYKAAASVGDYKLAAECVLGLFSVPEYEMTLKEPDAELQAARDEMEAVELPLATGVLEAVCVGKSHVERMPLFVAAARKALREWQLKVLPEIAVLGQALVQQ